MFNALENRNQLIWCIFMLTPSISAESIIIYYATIVFLHSQKSAPHRLFYFNSNLLHVILPSYLLLSSRHVGRLLRIKRIGNTAHHKDIKLKPLFFLFLLPSHLFQIVIFFFDRHWRARARWADIGASAWLQPTRAFAGPAWRHRGPPALGAATTLSSSSTTSSVSSSLDDGSTCLT